MPRPSGVMFMNETGWLVCPKYRRPTRRSPARVRITRLPVQYRETGFFPYFVPSRAAPRLVSASSSPRSSTTSSSRCRRRVSARTKWTRRNKVRPVASSYRAVRRRVPLRLHLPRASLFCAALNADARSEPGRRCRRRRRLRKVSSREGQSAVSRAF